MNVAFLGESTETKRFLILCLAKITSCHTKVTILSKHSYSFDEIYENYDYCGIEMILLKDGDNPLTKVSEEKSNFIDAEDLINIPEEYKVIAISEPTRKSLESCVKLAGDYTWFQPTLNLYIIHFNIMEYCKIGKRYLDNYWERGLPSFTEITEIYELYFEEKNQIVMIESQHSNRLYIRSLSPSMKRALRKIIQDIFSMDIGEAKVVLKKAERMK
jgi:hypothetical protein